MKSYRVKSHMDMSFDVQYKGIGRRHCDRVEDSTWAGILTDEHLRPGQPAESYFVGQIEAA